MLRLSGLLVALLAVQDAVSSPIHVRTSYAVKETHRAPHRWVRTERAAPEKILHLQIGVKQGNFDELDRQLSAGM